MKSTVTFSKYLELIDEMDSSSALGSTQSTGELVGNSDKFGTDDMRIYTPLGSKGSVQRRSGMKIKRKAKKGKRK